MSLKNEASIYEIVELDNGEIALRRADDNASAPLVTVKFSEESTYYLDEARFEVAKIMIEAGLDAVADLDEEDEVTEAVYDEIDETTVIH